MSAVTCTRILLIEDNPGDARLVYEMLQEAGTGRFTLQHASRLSEGHQYLTNGSFDVVLVDLSLPDAQGLDSVVQTTQAATTLPIVVMTGTDDEALALRAVQAGAQDYLVKGETDTRILVRTLRHALERNRLRLELELAKQRQQKLATHDALTGLPNRILLNDRLTHDLAIAKRQSQLLGVLFIDLNRFKIINDTLGHAVGDLLLQAVSKRLVTCLRVSDTVARFGGDEFVCILNNITRIEDAGIVAQKIIDTLSEPLSLDGHELFISPSIGIAISPHDGGDIGTLIKNADAAMYGVKEQGRSGYQFYSNETQAVSLERLALENKLRTALQQDQFVLHYQPVVDAATRKIVGVEALVRWMHPERGLVPPNDFIPLAEIIGVIVPLGEWVLRTACRQAKAWQTAGLPPMCIGVNVAGRQFTQRGLLEIVKQVLQGTGLDAHWLALELTEGTVMQNSDNVIKALNALRELGVRIAIDDFGTGYSSLNYLRYLPIDDLKIDRSFILNLTKDPKDEAIARAIITMAHNLSIRTVAEGVETPEQGTFLSNEGCQYLQGYLYSKPVPAEELTALLRKGYL